MPNLEVFHRPAANVPALTVSPRGLSLNRAAYAAIGQPDKVVCLYDSGSSIVGVRGVRPGDEPAVITHHVGSLYSGGLAPVQKSRGFLVRAGVELSPTRRFEAIVVDGMVCVDLSRPGVNVARARQ